MTGDKVTKFIVVRFAGLWASLAIIFGFFGCSRAVKTDEPIRIVPDKELVARLGEDVTWTFKAYRGSREVMVVESLPGDLPLGVVRKFDAKVPTLAGKVLARDVRHGVIRVTAFDERACAEAYEAMKKAATEQVKKTKDTNVSIPASPCDPVFVSSMSTPPEFMSYGYFAWHMIDGSDQVAIEDYGKFFAEHFGVASKRQPAINIVAVPDREAPHTVYPWLGSCAVRERSTCGGASDCLWGRVSCISKDAVGQSPAASSKEKGKS